MIAASTANTDSRSNPPLVLLAGWGHRASVWQDLVALAETDFDVHLVELPGYDAPLRSRESQPDTGRIIDQLGHALPVDSILCGWSLGGMLACQLAARYPERVAALVTLCSNPLFVARDDWRAAMPVATFDEFYRQVAADAVATLHYFQTLAALGSRSAKRDLRRLRGLSSVSPNPTAAALVDSLDWLASLDSRSAITALKQPQLHLLGAEDSLVPAAVAPDIVALNPAARVEVLPGVAHLPLVTCPERVLEQLREFLHSEVRRHVADAG